MVTISGNNSFFINRGVPRLEPHMLIAYGGLSADGFSSFPSYSYAKFFSNVTIPAGNTNTNIPIKFFHHIYIEYPVGFEIYKSARNCFIQKDALDLDRYMSLFMLRYAAVKYIFSYFVLKSEFIQSVNDIPNLQYQISCIPKDGSYPRPEILIYELKNTLPRISVAKKILVAHDDDNVLNVMRSYKYDTEPIAVVDDVTAKANNIKSIDYGDMPGVTHVHYKTPDKIAIDVNVKKDTILIVRDSFTPFLKVYCDGKQVNYFRVNMAFIGINIGQEAKHVELNYQ
ncbi:MAG: hypothetical protein HQK92_02215 [Nitrospirae bacterium]|nr:hypothetical protein [Nitrospirota bacterium]